MALFPCKMDTMPWSDGTPNQAFGMQASNSTTQNDSRYQSFMPGGQMNGNPNMYGSHTQPTQHSDYRNVYYNTHSGQIANGNYWNDKATDLNSVRNQDSFAANGSGSGFSEPVSQLPLRNQILMNGNGSYVAQSGPYVPQSHSATYQNPSKANVTWTVMANRTNTQLAPSAIGAIPHTQETLHFSRVDSGAPPSGTQSHGDLTANDQIKKITKYLKGENVDPYGTFYNSAERNPNYHYLQTTAVMGQSAMSRGDGTVRKSNINGTNGSNEAVTSPTAEMTSMENVPVNRGKDIRENLPSAIPSRGRHFNLGYIQGLLSMSQGSVAVARTPATPAGPPPGQSSSWSAGPGVNSVGGTGSGSGTVSKERTNNIQPSGATGDYFSRVNQSHNGVNRNESVSQLRALVSGYGNSSSAQNAMEWRPSSNVPSSTAAGNFSANSSCTEEQSRHFPPAPTNHQLPGAENPMRLQEAQYHTQSYNGKEQQLFIPKTLNEGVAPTNHQLPGAENPMRDQEAQYHTQSYNGKEQQLFIPKTLNEGVATTRHNGPAQMERPATNQIPLSNFESQNGHPHASGSGYRFSSAFPNQATQPHKRKPEDQPSDNPPPYPKTQRYFVTVTQDGTVFTANNVLFVTDNHASALSEQLQLTSKERTAKSDSGVPYGELSGSSDPKNCETQRATAITRAEPVFIMPKPTNQQKGAGSSGQRAVAVVPPISQQSSNSTDAGSGIINSNEGLPFKIKNVWSLTGDEYATQQKIDSTVSVTVSRNTGSYENLKPAIFTFVPAKHMDSSSHSKWAASPLQKTAHSSSHSEGAPSPLQETAQSSHSEGAPSPLQETAHSSSHSEGAASPLQKTAQSSSHSEGAPSPLQKTAQSSSHSEGAASPLQETAQAPDLVIQSTDAVAENDIEKSNPSDLQPKPPDVAHQTEKISSLNVNNSETLPSLSVINSGDQSGESKENTFDLSSVPVFDWTVTRLYYLMSVLEKKCLKRKGQVEMDLDKLYGIYGSCSYPDHSDVFSSDLYMSIMKEASSISRRQNVIFSQIKKTHLKEVIENCHILRHDATFSEDVVYKSSWLNLNEQLDDIDKENGLPLHLSLRRPTLEEEYEDKEVNESDKSNLPPVLTAVELPASSSSRHVSHSDDPLPIVEVNVLQSEEVNESDKNNLPPVLTAVELPASSSSKHVSHSDDPLPTVEVNVLPSEEVNESDESNLPPVLTAVELPASSSSKHVSHSKDPLPANEISVLPSEVEVNETENCSLAEAPIMQEAGERAEPQLPMQTEESPAPEEDVSDFSLEISVLSGEEARRFFNEITEKSEDLQREVPKPDSKEKKTQTEAELPEQPLKEGEKSQMEIYCCLARWLCVMSGYANKSVCSCQREDESDQEKRESGVSKNDNVVPAASSPGRGTLGTAQSVHSTGTANLCGEKNVKGAPDKCTVTERKSVDNPVQDSQHRATGRKVGRPSKQKAEMRRKTPSDQSGVENHVDGNAISSGSRGTGKASLGCTEVGAKCGTFGKQDGSPDAKGLKRRVHVHKRRLSNENNSHKDENIAKTESKSRKRKWEILNPKSSACDRSANDLEKGNQKKKIKTSCTQAFPEIKTSVVENKSRTSQQEERKGDQYSESLGPQVPKQVKNERPRNGPANNGEKGKMPRNANVLVLSKQQDKACKVSFALYGSSPQKRGGTLQRRMDSKPIEIKSSAGTTSPPPKTVSFDDTSKKTDPFQHCTPVRSIAKQQVYAKWKSSLVSKFNGAKSPRGTPTTSTSKFDRHPNDPKPPTSQTSNPSLSQLVVTPIKLKAVTDCPKKSENRKSSTLKSTDSELCSKPVDHIASKNTSAKRRVTIDERQCNSTAGPGRIKPKKVEWRRSTVPDTAMKSKYELGNPALVAPQQEDGMLEFKLLPESFSFKDGEDPGESVKPKEVKSTVSAEIGRPQSESLTMSKWKSQDSWSKSSADKDATSSEAKSPGAQSTPSGTAFLEFRRLYMAKGGF